jgi:beta-propeller uncharacterized protein DUF5122
VRIAGRRRAPSPPRVRRGVAGALITGIAFVQLLTAPVAAAGSPQTISFDLPASDIVGSAFDPAGTATSGLPVAYASDTPSTCSVEGIVLTLTAEGTCTVTASQAGDATWDPAPYVQDSMTVDPAPPPPPVQQPQTISFTLPPNGHVGATMAITGTASSGLPVSYAVQTPSICASDGTTLALDAAGTCTVTASQAGDQEWLPAPDVIVSTTVTLPPIVTSDGANLGRYALNGPIQSMVIDPETGITYVGGTFTEIGVRTGSVALVEPPDSGSDALKAASPDVIGSELKVFPDDATGYFVAGHIGSVNGDGAMRDFVNRMTTAGQVDTSWSFHTTCGTTDPPDWAKRPAQWDLGDTLATNVNLSPTTSGDSTIGLSLIDKDTGLAKRTGAGDAACGASGRVWSSTPVFAPLASCTGWIVCLGYVIDVVKDPGSNSLITAVSVQRGQTIDTQERRQTWLIAYDLTSGARRWALRLESSSAPSGFPANTDWGAEVRQLAGLGGSILVSGRFPLEAVNRSNGEFTNTLLVDEASGTILQRWNELGEQAIGDPVGSEIAPATACTPVVNSVTSYEQWRFVARSATHSVGYGQPTIGGDGSRTYAVCDYAVSGTGLAAHLAATSLGVLAATPSPDILQPLPSTLYGGHILVGPYDAFDLDAGGAIAGWHPSPSSGSVTLAVAGSTVVIVGDATFMHGQRAFHVVALDRDLAPVSGFDSGLLTPAPSNDWFRNLELDGDHVVLAGRFLGPSGATHLVALDKSTGDIAWSAPSTSTTFPWGLAVDPATNAIYVGFEGVSDSYIKRYLPSGGGYQLDATFVPAFVGIDGAFPAVTALTWVDGRLYVGGPFESIDGQARQGLARYDVDGDLDSWSPSLLTEMGVPTGATTDILPIAFLEVGPNVVVTGRFNYSVPIPGGGGFANHAQPGVRVYSVATGALVRPIGGASWFGSTQADYGNGSATIDGVVYVAFGSSGILAFDAATFDYLPYLSVRTFPGWGSNAIYDVAARPAGASVAGLATAATSSSLVFGGLIPTWKTHTASNVLELGTGALNSDHAAPTVSAVKNRPRTGGAFVGGAAPWTVTWTGKDTGGSGVARYELAQSRNGGTWTVVNVNLHSITAAVALGTGSTYRFRVRAVDRAGNVGSWVYGSTFKLKAVSQSSTSVHYRGTWVTSTSSTAWWGGTAKSSSTKGSTASFTFTGRSIAWVGLKAANRGKAYVYINGVLKATVDLYSATTLKQRVVWSAYYSASATRTITIKVLATSGRPRVDVDGFLVGS